MAKVYHSQPFPASRTHRATRLALLAGLGWLLALLVGNWRSLREGLVYLGYLRSWQTKPVLRIDQHGPYGSCYNLVLRTNAERCQLVINELHGLGLTVEQVPVPGDPLPNLFVRLGPDGPLTLFCAHYDTSRETATYQGASDNTAAVAVLLAALHSLIDSGVAIRQPVGFLFTSAEERGFLGAKAFVAYARQRQLPITAAINIDMLGRDQLAIRPSALPGFYFWLPLVGWFAYDGRQIRPGNAYMQPAAPLIQRIKRAASSGLLVYRRFTAASDSNIFQQAGIPTVSLSSSNMFYLDTIWERDSDRVELLDQCNLELAHQLICHMAAQPADLL